MRNSVSQQPVTQALMATIVMEMVDDALVVAPADDGGHAGLVSRMLSPAAHHGR
jgi:hypothetical protein